MTEYIAIHRKMIKITGLLLSFADHLKIGDEHSETFFTDLPLKVCIELTRIQCYPTSFCR